MTHNTETDTQTHTQTHTHKHTCAHSSQTHFWRTAKHIVLVLGVVGGRGLIALPPASGPATVYPPTEPTRPTTRHVPLAIKAGAGVEVVREERLAFTGADKPAVGGRVKEELLVKDFAILWFHEVLVGAGEEVHLGDGEILLSDG